MIFDDEEKSIHQNEEQNEEQDNEIIFRG